MSEKIAKWFIETSYLKLVSITFLILSGLMMGALKILGELSLLIEQKAITAVVFMFILGISYVAINGIKNSALENRY